MRKWRNQEIARLSLEECAATFRIVSLGMTAILAPPEEVQHAMIESDD